MQEAAFNQLSYGVDGPEIMRPGCGFYLLRRASIGSTTWRLPGYTALACMGSLVALDSYRQ